MRDLAGLGVECDTLVEASPERLWAVVGDIETPTRFSPELRSVAWLGDAAGPRVGAQFEGHNENPRIGTWRTVCEVVDWEPPHRFGWVVMEADGNFATPATAQPQPRVRWYFTLHPADGGVQLRHGMQLTDAPSGLHVALARRPDRADTIVEWRLASLRAGIEDTLRGVKALAETPPR